MNRRLRSNLGISIVMLRCFVLFAVSQSEAVNAQQPGNLTKIIEQKFPGKGTLGLSHSVQVNYESPTSIILNGDLIYNLQFNSDLWNAMDILRNQYGFKIQQVMTSGVGSEVNPTVVYILMTK